MKTHLHGSIRRLLMQRRLPEIRLRNGSDRRPQSGYSFASEIPVGIGRSFSAQWIFPDSTQITLFLLKLLSFLHTLHALGSKLGSSEQVELGNPGGHGGHFVHLRYRATSASVISIVCALDGRSRRAQRLFSLIPRRIILWLSIQSDCPARSGRFRSTGRFRLIDGRGCDRRFSGRGTLDIFLWDRIDVTLILSALTQRSVPRVSLGLLQRWPERESDSFGRSGGLLGPWGVWQKSRRLAAWKMWRSRCEFAMLLRSDPLVSWHAVDYLLGKQVRVVIWNL